MEKKEGYIRKRGTRKEGEEIEENPAILHRPSQRHHHTITTINQSHGLTEMITLSNSYSPQRLTFPHPQALPHISGVFFLF